MERTPPATHAVDTQRERLRAASSILQNLRKGKSPYDICLHSDDQLKEERDLAKDRGSFGRFHDRERLAERQAELEREQAALGKETAALTAQLAKAGKRTAELKQKCAELSRHKEMEEMARHQAALARGKGGGRHKGPLPDRSPEDFRIRPDMLDFEGLTAVEMRSRIQDLKKVINKLRDSQPALEQEAADLEQKVERTQERKQRYTERLKAMPKKFTETFEEMEEELRGLREEKLQLQIEKDSAKQRSEAAEKELQKQEREARRELYNLEEEVAFAEEDRDRWARRYENEVDRFESLKMEKSRLLKQITHKFDEGIETVVFYGRDSIHSDEIVPAVQPYFFPEVTLSEPLLQQSLERLDLLGKEEYSYQDFCCIFKSLSSLLLEKENDNGAETSG